MTTLEHTSPMTHFLFTVHLLNVTFFFLSFQENLGDRLRRQDSMLQPEMDVTLFIQFSNETF